MRVRNLTLRALAAAVGVSRHSSKADGHGNNNMGNGETTRNMPEILQKLTTDLQTHLQECQIWKTPVQVYQQ